MIHRIGRQEVLLPFLHHPVNRLGIIVVRADGNPPPVFLDRMNRGEIIFPPEFRVLIIAQQAHQEILLRLHRGEGHPLQARPHLSSIARYFPIYQGDDHLIQQPHISICSIS